MKKTVFFIICLAVGLILNCSTDQEYDYASINFFVGEVTKNGKVVEIGDLIYEKDVIATSEQSSCDIKIGKSIIRIKEKSSLEFSGLIVKNGKENTTLGLEIGRILCKPKKLLKGEKFLVKTPTAVAGVRGTQFTVEADKKLTTRIKVYDGKVKVVKRVKAVESNIDKVLEAVPALQEKEKVIVTLNDVKAAEKQVAKFVTDKTPVDEFVKVLGKVSPKVAIKGKQIGTFKPEDFQEEQSEIIAVKEKPEKVIKEIKKIIKLDKGAKAPQGRLLITRYEVYYIKDGKISWEGDVVEPPVTYKKKVYIASGDYIFCASPKGPVIWKTKVKNDGKMQFKNKTMFIYDAGKEIRLNMLTGQKM